MSNINEQRTVTLPLEEYLVMKENAEQLTKAINERKIIYVGNDTGVWYRYYITDENTAVEGVKREAIDNQNMAKRFLKELDELKAESKRHYAVEEKRYIDLWRKYNNASLWTRIRRVFNKQY
jgi:hypothetical protein